jgi:hypothetical protein
MKSNRIFTKKAFDETKPFTKKKAKIDKKEEIDEFYDLDDNNITVSNNTEIFSNVPKSAGDESEFEQSIPTITDKLAMYANPRNWWQLYLRGYPLIRTYSLFENDFKDIIKELLDSKDEDDDILPKDEREQKVKKIKKEIRRNKFTESDLEELENLIRKKLNKNG